MKEYICCYIDDKKINNYTINFLKDFKMINIFSFNLIEYKKEEYQDVYYYCFNEEQIRYCNKNNFKINLCLTTNTIDLLKFYKEDMEFFYFPSKEDLVLKELSFINKFKFMQKIPTCIFTLKQYNDVFLYGEEFLLFYKKIKDFYGNLKIFDVEKKLIEMDFEFDNYYLHQKNDIIESGNLTLGMITDLKNKDGANLTNKKNLLKNKNCLACDYLNKCIGRNYGSIMEDFKTQNCVGIKLLS